MRQPAEYADEIEREPTLPAGSVMVTILCDGGERYE